MFSTTIPFSPAANASKTPTSSSVLRSIEYTYFLEAIRNLVDRSFSSKGAIKLGQYYLFPNTKSSTDNDIVRNIIGSQRQPFSHFTTLACSYQVYLTSSNLVFQPVATHLHITPLKAQDLVGDKEKKVLLSPAGIVATLECSSQSTLVEDRLEVLKEWSTLFGIPVPSLAHSNSIDSRLSSLPPLVTVVTSGGKRLRYPTGLIFVPSDDSSISSLHCSDSIGDPVDKLNRLAWRESLKHKRQMDGAKRPELEDPSLNSNVSPSLRLSESAAKRPCIDFWSYRNPEVEIAMSVLAHCEKAVTTDKSVRALEKPTRKRSIKPRSGVSSPVLHHSTSDKPTPTSEEISTSPMPGNSTGISVLETKADPSSLVNVANTTPQTPNLASLTYNSGGSGSKAAIPAQNFDPSQDINLGNKNNNGSDAPNASGPIYPSPPDIISANAPLDSMELSMDHSINSVMMMSHDFGDLDEGMEVTEDDFSFFDEAPKGVAGLESMDSSLLGTTVEESLPSIPTTDNLGSQQADGLVLGDVNLQAFLGTTGSTADVSLVLEEQEPVSTDFIDLVDGMDVEPTQPSIASSITTTAPLPPSASAVTTTNTTRNTTSTASTAPSTMATSASPKVASVSLHPSEPHVIPINTTDAECRASLIPPEFAPLQVLEGVNDSKYQVGGKFVVRLPRSIRNKRPLRKSYKPDYCPHNRLKRLQKPISYAISQRKNGAASKLLNHFVSNKENDISSDEDASDLESESGESEGENVMEEDVLDSARWTLLYRSETLAYRPAGTLFSDKESLRVLCNKNSTGRDTFVQDLLFAPIIAPHWKEIDVKEDNKAGNSILDTLPRDEYMKTVQLVCRQAVVGGYPFCGGLAEVTENGGEMLEGEHTQFLVARRQKLLQRIYESLISTPVIGDEFRHIISEFKSILTSAFERVPWENSDTHSNPSMAATHIPLALQPPSSSSTVVKGPLTVQQYYDLSETNQTQSKYGKYQVKKRRPAEPNLDALPLPDILLGHNDEWLEASPASLPFWEKLRLEPYGPRKNVHWFVLHPDTEAITDHTRMFFRELSVIYETCQLGLHQPGCVGDYKGFVPVPLLPASGEESSREQQMKSYMAVCQNLENIHFVVYLLNPFSHRSSIADLCHCFTKLLISYDVATMGTVSAREKAHDRVLLQILPIEHMIRSAGFGGYLQFGLKEIAFSVYEKCAQLVEKNNWQSEEIGTITEIYSPPFVLAKSPPNKIQFSLKRTLEAYPSPIDAPIMLHLAYTFSANQRWFICAWVDDHGELVEYSLMEVRSLSGGKHLGLQAILGEVWNRTCRIMRRASVGWKVFVAKLGLITQAELVAWTEVLGQATNVYVVCTDLNTPLHVFPGCSTGFGPGNMGTSGIETRTTDNSTSNTPTPAPAAGIPTPEPVATPTSSGAAPVGPAVVKEQGGNTEAYAILLNHRVAIQSQQPEDRIPAFMKEEKESSAALSPEKSPCPTMSVEDCDDEMPLLSLASGYLAEIPVASEYTRPFGCQPYAVHIVHASPAGPLTTTLQELLRNYHALSFLNQHPTRHCSLPLHFVLVDRLFRILLLID
ncbi:uncharacterized protein VTP21DRAFT_588 [Calcarisporiella thermophila]|uniref:uncharacterized protein n=1 Tax=Calcarisporiella thermophila TaxID=911321 RepID=UPI0037429C19